MWRALKKWYKFTQTVKTQYNQIYIYSPWNQRPNKNNGLPLSKQNMHNKLFKQDLSYFSKKILVRQKALITFLVPYQWDFCCCMTGDRDFTLSLYFVAFRDIHKLLVSSVRLLLLGDLMKFITKNTDSQTYVDENMESNLGGVEAFFGWLSGEVSEFRTPVAVCCPPTNWETWRAVDTALFVAI